MKALLQRVREAHVEVVEVPGVGHAPTLVDAAQVAVVRDFLLDQG